MCLGCCGRREYESESDEEDVGHSRTLSQGSMVVMTEQAAINDRIRRAAICELAEEELDNLRKDIKNANKKSGIFYSKKDKAYMREVINTKQLRATELKRIIQENSV